MTAYFDFLLDKFMEEEAHYPSPPSREKRESSDSRPPAFFAPFASCKAYLPDAGSETYRPGAECHTMFEGRQQAV